MCITLNIYFWDAFLYRDKVVLVPLLVRFLATLLCALLSLSLQGNVFELRLIALACAIQGHIPSLMASLDGSLEPFAEPVGDLIIFSKT